MKAKLLKKLRKKAKKEIGIAYIDGSFYVGYRVLLKRKLTSLCDWKNSLETAKEHLAYKRMVWILNKIKNKKLEKL